MLNEKFFEFVDNDNAFAELNPDIKRIYSEAKKDLFLNETNIQQKALTQASLRVKWVMLLFSQKNKINKLKEQKNSVISSLKDKLATSPEYAHKAAIQIERMVQDSPKIKKVNELIFEEEQILSFIQQIVNIFNDFGFAIKNSIDTIKINHG